MCGLVGYFGEADTKVKTVLRHLLEIDVVRGPHSTGIGTVNKEGHFRISKDAVLPQVLFKDKSFSTAMSKNFDVFIGHNRYATVGKINKANAHPFKYPNIIGAHNGTIKGIELLLDYHKFSSDSNNLFYMIEEEGIEETWANLDGAAAISYWNKDNETLNLLRNVQRPLCFARTADKKHLFWASEPWMLESIKKKFYIIFEQTKGNYIWSGEPNILFSFFKNQDKTISWRTQKLPQFTWATCGAIKTKEWWYKLYGTQWKLLKEKEAKELAPKMRRHYSQVKKEAERWTGYSGNKYNKGKYHPPEKVFHLFGRGKNAKEVVLVDFNNRILKEDEFNRKYQTCAVCADWLVYEEGVVFVNHDTAVCAPCNEALISSNVHLGISHLN